MPVSDRQRELLTELGYPTDYVPDTGTSETDFLYEVYVALRSVERQAMNSAKEAGAAADKVKIQYEGIFAALAESRAIAMVDRVSTLKGDEEAIPRSLVTEDSPGHQAGGQGQGLPHP